MLKKYDDGDIVDLQEADHIVAMTAGALGAYFHRFAKEKHIPIRMNYKLDRNTQAAYCYSPYRSASNGHIEYGRRGLNALLLAHELRHAWQHVTLPSGILAPSDPQSYIMARRFVEADARAVHLGATLQIINGLRPDHVYSKTLLNMILKEEKFIINPVTIDIDEVALDERALKQVMRDAFDQWMIHLIDSDYDAEIYQRMAEGEKLSNKVGKWGQKGLKLSMPLMPIFNQASMNADYPMALATAMGNLEPVVKGNYLLDTQGPDLTSEVYSRISHPHLERAVERIHHRIIG
jgi:hypothetical protein